MKHHNPWIVTVKISTFTFTSSCFVSKRCIYHIKDSSDIKFWFIKIILIAYTVLLIYIIRNNVYVSELNDSFPMKTDLHFQPTLS